MCWTSNVYFKRRIDRVKILNCKTTVYDVNTSLATYSPLEPILKRNMTIKFPQHVEGYKFMHIPSTMLKLNPTCYVTVDFFFFKRIFFILIKFHVHKFRGLNN